MSDEKKDKDKDKDKDKGDRSLKDKDIKSVKQGLVAAGDPDCPGPGDRHRPIINGGPDVNPGADFVGTSDQNCAITDKGTSLQDWSGNVPTP